MQQSLRMRVQARTLARPAGRHGRPRPLLCRSEKEKQQGYIGQMDLLDFVTAGPKMRKWYGGQELKKGEEPSEGGPPEGQPMAPVEDEPPAEAYDVLVMDADSATGEQLVLQLILARAKLRVLVRDVAAARAGFGPYVDPVSLDAGAGGALARALRGVRSVAVLGRLGAVLPAARQAGVQRVVLLSSAGMPRPGGLAGLFTSKEDTVLREPQREADVAASGLAYTIIRTAAIQDVPGGGSALVLRRGELGVGAGDGGTGVSREDLAAVVAAALQADGWPSGCVVEVVATGAGRPPADLGAALRQAVGCQ